MGGIGRARAAAGRPVGGGPAAARPRGGQEASRTKKYIKCSAQGRPGGEIIILYLRFRTIPIAISDHGAVFCNLWLRGVSILSAKSDGRVVKNGTTGLFWSILGNHWTRKVSKFIGRVFKNRGTWNSISHVRPGVIYFRN